MQQFIGTKVLNGMPFTKAQYCELRKWTIPPNEDPNELGYLVEYALIDPLQKPNVEGFDGYISWLPQIAFEDAYHLTNKLSFGDALYFVKQGKRIARAGWNGANQFVVYVNPYLNNQFTIIEKPGLLGTFAPYLALRAVNNTLNPWVPSQSDQLAEDWLVVSEQ